MSGKNPFEKIVKIVLILSMVFNVIAFCGLIVFAVLEKEAYHVYGSMMVACFIGGLLQAFYFYAASSSSLSKQTWALGLMITTMVLSVVGAIVYLLFMLVIMDFIDSITDHENLFVRILLSVTMPLWGVAVVVQVVLLVLWVKLRHCTAEGGFQDVEGGSLQ
ncbi:hypothetical protein QOT17_011882 [Balamuthia mandrillaris]